MISDPKYVNDAGDLEVLVDGAPLLISPMTAEDRDFPIGPDVWHTDAEGYLLEADGTRMRIGGEARRPEDLSDGVLRLHAVQATVKLVYATARAGVYGALADYVAPEPEPPTEDDVRAEGERRLQVVAGKYRLGERDTWPIQVAEAQAWTADNQATVPFLTAEAAETGETVADLVARIFAKQAEFVGPAGAVIGAQRALIAMDPIPADFADDAWWP